MAPSNLRDRRPLRRRRALFLTLVGALGSLTLACNALLGISDYERGTCNGGGVCSDAGFGDGPIDRSPQPDVVTVDASGTRPVSWAHFVMPNYPQDGGENVPTYAAVAADQGGGLQDSVTKLVWSDSKVLEDEAPMSWATAQALCASLEPEKTWRIPSRIELVTLLDMSQPSGTRISGAFQYKSSFEYWTSSEVRRPNNTPTGEVTGEHWTVNFASNAASVFGQTDGKAKVRCIKGAQ